MKNTWNDRLFCEYDIRRIWLVPCLAWPLLLCESKYFEENRIWVRSILIPLAKEITSVCARLTLARVRFSVLIDDDWLRQVWVRWLRALPIQAKSLFGRHCPSMGISASFCLRSEYTVSLVFLRAMLVMPMLPQHEKDPFRITDLLGNKAKRGHTLLN